MPLPTTTIPFDHPPTRIHITGDPGSGKTTLGKTLAELLGVSCYQLDKVAYENGYGRKRTLDERLADVAEIVSHSGWVTEGGFLWWTDGLMEAADLIVWLDLPFRINAWRMVWRHTTLTWAGTNPHPGWMNLARFMGYCGKSYYASEPIQPATPDDDGALTRIGRAKEVDRFISKVVHCRTPQEVAAFVEMIGHSAEG